MVGWSRQKPQGVLLRQRSGPNTPNTLELEEVEGKLEGGGRRRKEEEGEEKEASS